MLLTLRMFESVTLTKLVKIDWMKHFHFQFINMELDKGNQSHDSCC